MINQSYLHIIFRSSTIHTFIYSLESFTCILHLLRVYYELTKWPAPRWLDSSVVRALHRCYRGHGPFRPGLFSSVNCLHIIISFSAVHILVPRAYDPSGLRQESRALGATMSGMRHRCRLRSETGWAEFGYFLCYFKMVASRAFDSCRRPEGSKALRTRMRCSNIFTFIYSLVLI